ncbi:MAG: PcfJ domain-containing protein, partial [Bacteroidota bacterium]
LDHLNEFVKFGTGTFAHHPEVSAQRQSQPNFSWKGKKLNKLYQDLDLLFCPRYNPPANLSTHFPFSYGEHIYEVVWLDTRRALTEEGEIMDHCVGDYHWECVEGESVIFSLRRKQEDGRDWSELTIELGQNGDRYFVNQALGKFNEDPTDEQKKLLKIWLDAQANVDREDF